MMAKKITIICFFCSITSLQVFHRNSFETQDFTTTTHPQSFNRVCQYVNDNQFEIQFDFWIKSQNQLQNQDATILCLFTRNKNTFFCLSISIFENTSAIKKQKENLDIVVPEAEVALAWNHLNLKLSQTKFFENDVDLEIALNLNGSEVLSTQVKVFHFLAENEQYKIHLCSKDYFGSFCDR